MRIITLGFFLLLLISNAFAQDKLIFALDLIRHGDRTPIHSVPAATYQWPEGAGQLTTRGMAQEYQLGKKLRQYYIEKQHFLPEIYKSELMYVRSTDYDRTLMSAQAFLMGFYPAGNGPQGYQPIPIHTQPVDNDAIIPKQLVCDSCKEDLFKKYVYPQKAWQQKQTQLMPKFKQWGQAIGSEIHELRQLAKLGDTFYIYQQHHIPLPKDLSQQDIAEIIHEGNWALAHLFTPQSIGNNMGQGLLSLVTQYLQEGAKQQTPLKYVLLFGHDSSIMTLFSAMSAPLEEPPPYASRVNFSLYEKSSGEHYVTVSYNDKSMAIPHCGKSECTLTTFSELAETAKSLAQAAATQ